jgi:hypothetical protein
MLVRLLAARGRTRFALARARVRFLVRVCTRVVVQRRWGVNVRRSHCRAQRMAADPAAFTVTSDQGAAVEGRVLVRWVGYTSRGFPSWALVGAPIESMFTVAGDAWAEFVLVEFDWWVFVFVAPEELGRAACAVSTAGSGAVACGLYGGDVWVNGARVRDSTPDWGAHMAPGESVRVRYVAATRMVSVVRRGRAYDLAALPATADIAHMRFGVSLGRDNSMRVTGASAGALCAHAGCVARPCVLDSRCSWLFRSSQRTSTSHTCDVSCAPA